MRFRCLMSVRLVAAVLAVSALALAPGLSSAATKYPTRFTRFKLKGTSSGARFKGRIHSTKGKCINKRNAKLFRKHNGKKKKLGSDKTNQKGKFGIELPGKLKNGSYYAKVKRKDFDNGAKVCLDVTSPKVRVSG